MMGLGVTRHGSVLVLALQLALACSCSCHREPTVEQEQAMFGVLFGGQVQQRTRIPFELDTSKQSVGFRIEVTPSDRVRRVQWELTKPSSSGDPTQRDYVRAQLDLLTKPPAAEPEGTEEL